MISPFALASGYLQAAIASRANVFAARDLMIKKNATLKVAFFISLKIHI